jgi:hypothetical protein
METVCCIIGASACSALEEAMGSETAAQMEELCTMDGRNTMIQRMFPDNFTACEGNCSGAMDVYQGWIFISMDAASAAEQNSETTSKKMVARLRQYACANVDVMTCAATPGGAGYVACDTDDGDDEDGSPAPAPAPAPSCDAGDADPVCLLAECDVALAVKVAMEITVDDPAEFVADPANKMAVEAGIAEAAGVDASDVEAVLTVARRLQESLRRLTGGAVNVEATIHTEDAAAATAMVATVAAIEPAAMTEALETAFEDAGINVTIEVANIAEPETQSADQAVAEAAAAASSGGSSGSASSGTANGAHRESVAAGVLAVLAVFAATATM